HGGPPAGVARVVDARAAPRALRAHLRERERSLVDEDLPSAAALRADVGRGAGLGARAVAHGADRIGGEAHAGRDAVHGVEEVEGELGLEVGAALRTGLARPSSPPPAATPAPEPAHAQLAPPAPVADLGRLGG